MIQQVDVPEDKDLMPYFTDKALTQDYVDCFASFIPIEYEIDEDGVKTETEIHTDQERARQFIAKQLDKIFIKWQLRQAVSSVVPKSGGIS